ncbi:MAG: TetR/AcrR family transcriptional regulator [Capsulimonadaceae bacterium]|nr:TetR/AcrR family transcriptional regulator [Capsulimonadaceae bacterium]
MGTEERRQREKERRRRDIIEAARVLFIQQGFRDTTIDDIAKMTELARGTVYLYFENKEAIYATVLDEGLDLLLNLIEESHDPNVDPLTNLLRAHDAFLKFHDDHPEYYGVLILDKLGIEEAIPKELSDRLHEKTRCIVDGIARNIQQGIDEDMFRPMPVRDAAVLQMGLSMGFTMALDICKEGDPLFSSRSDAREMLHALIANGVLAQRPVTQA